MTEQANNQEQNQEKNQETTDRSRRFVWGPEDVQITPPSEKAQETAEERATAEPKAHWRTVKAADTALMKATISQESHAAILAGRISLDEGRALGREAGPDGPAGQSAKKATGKPTSKKDRSRSCMCGCGRETKGRFAMGHDARVKGWIVKAVREGTFDQLSEEIQAYAAERDLVRQTEQRMADEQAKKAEKAKAKADAQRAKEGAAEKE